MHFFCLQASLTSPRHNVYSLLLLSFSLSSSVDLLVLVTSQNIHVQLRKILWKAIGSHYPQHALSSGGVSGSGSSFMPSGHPPCLSLHNKPLQQPMMVRSYKRRPGTFAWSCSIKTWVMKPYNSHLRFLYFFFVNFLYAVQVSISKKHIDCDEPKFPCNCVKYLANEWWCSRSLPMHNDNINKSCLGAQWNVQLG